MKFAKSKSLYLAWLIALVATLLSLYFGIIEKIPVCELCWYQRVCLYPLVIILGIAAYREDNAIALYTLPLAALGALLALYQYLEQIVPGFSPIALCSPNHSCSQIEWIIFGFVTIPFLNLIANLLMILFLSLSYSHRSKG